MSRLYRVDIGVARLDGESKHHRYNLVIKTYGLNGAHVCNLSLSLCGCNQLYLLPLTILMREKGDLILILIRDFNDTFILDPIFLYIM